MDAPPPSQRRAVNWSTLLPDVLMLIMHSLSMQDCLAVRGVCSPWREAAKKYTDRVYEHLPFRLMVRRPAPEGRTAVLGFFNLRWRRLLDAEVSDAAAVGRFRCCGHRDGWLAMVSDEENEMLLLNPVTGARVRLPTSSRASSPRSPGPLMVDVKKVIMSSSPSAMGCIVAALGMGSHLALCRPEDGDKWITFDAGRTVGIEDAMFAHSGKLFVLTADSNLRIYDLRSYPRSAAVVSVVRPGVHLVIRNYSNVARYLVELSGEVMVVSREHLGYPHSLAAAAAAAFRVFKLLLHGPSASWIPVTHLGDRSLFLSSTSCEWMKVPASSKKTRLRKNCIYVTRKVNSFPCHGDVGVFTVASMRVLTSIRIPGEHLHDHEAVWFKPSL